MSIHKPTKAEIESPANPSQAYLAMAPRWSMINALLGGTEAMREAAEELLPRHHREYAEDYEERLRCSVLFNVFEITLDNLAGKPFTEPLTLEEDVPADIVNYAEDIDLKGNHIDQFSAMVFRDGLAKGLTHIMVDTPSKDGENPRTLAAEREAGIRPYMIHVQPENVLAADAVVINGEEVLTHLRIYESDLERVGFAEKLVERIRVFNLVVDDEGNLMVVVTVYRKAERKVGGKDRWAIERTIPTEHTEIPVYTFYAHRAGFMQSKPPLLDLAYMNVQHWQSSSDQFNVLKVARFPILAASGIETDNAETTLGPRNVLEIDNPEGRYYYVEHTGAAIEAGRKSLQDLVDTMALYGATMLRRRPDRETATSRSLEERNQSAPLQKMALAFKDTLENALRGMAMMIGEEDGGSIVIHTDFGFDGGEVVDLQTLQVAYKDFAISREGFLQELKRRKVLSDEFDVDEDATQLLKEIEERIGAILTKPTAATEEPEDGEEEEDPEDVRPEEEEETEE